MAVPVLPPFRSPRSLVESTPTTIPELYEWNARENANYPLFRFHDGESVKTLTYAQTAHAIRRAARFVRSIVGSGQHSRVPVAVLANVDSITYAVASVGVLRAGHILFPISVRNGAAAVAELLRRTGCRHVLVSSDHHLQSVARDAVREVALEDVALHPMVTFEDLFVGGVTASPAGAVLDEDDDLPSEYDADEVAMILHSSGSTGHPKPIYWTHKRMVSRGTTPWYGEVDYTGLTFACHGIPMFHAQGISYYTTAPVTGCVIAVFPPTDPPMVPNTENVFEGAVLTFADYIVTVPLFVEEWARAPEKVAHMRRIRGLVFGGAELQEEIGDALASQGISLVIVYGCTEVGAVANVIPAKPGMNWSWFSITPWIQTKQVDAGDGKFEIVVLSPSDCPLAAVNTKVGDVDAYSTSDLVIPHPSIPGLWKIYGRRDDQIVLTNGEKANPLPIERIIREDPRIEECIAFGTGRFHIGVLVKPHEQYAFNDKDPSLRAQFVDEIWPQVEQVNQIMPQQCRIFKEMILIATSSKPFEYNAKGNIRRHHVLQQYSQDIDALYESVIHRRLKEISGPATWDLENTKIFVRSVVNRTLPFPVADDADIFRSGCDSLQATWIRNTILRALEQSSPTAAAHLHQLPVDAVFQAPSIAALADTLHQTVQNSSQLTTNATSAEHLEELVQRYTKDLAVRPAQLQHRPNSKEVILVTGTTGGFGCDVLEHLLSDERVELVYAFNRRGSNLIERQRQRFRERGLEEALVDSQKLKMVEVDLDIPGFNLDPGLLDEIRSTITHIMHNAWKVDFLLALPTFEVDLKGVRNLLELAISSSYVQPPKFQFVSSIGVLRQSNSGLAISEDAVPASSAAGSGYAEAKWLAEEMIMEVSRRTGMPATIVRLGQVCGDKLGHWNEKEWFAAMVKSSLITGTLPNHDITAAFIPSYSAARAFTEMRNTSSSYAHLAHPRPTPWTDFVTSVAEELNLRLVPLSDWVANLEQLSRPSGDSPNPGDIDVSDPRHNPALMLLGWFRSWVGSAGPVFARPISTEKARAAAPTLETLPALTGEDAKAWVRAWRESGFLRNA